MFSKGREGVVRSLHAAVHKGACCVIFQEPEAGFPIPVLTWPLRTLFFYSEYSCGILAAIVGTSGKGAFLDNAGASHILKILAAGCNF